jgi:hypothetical protein
VRRRRPGRRARRLLRPWSVPEGPRRLPSCNKQEQWPGVGCCWKQRRKTKELSTLSAKQRTCGWSETQQQHSENNTKQTKILGLESNCGWSGTQQQLSNNNTKRTMIWMTSKPVEFSRKTVRKWGAIRGEMAKTVAGVELNNNTDSTKTRTQTTTGTKNMRTVLKCLFEICTTMMCWRRWGAGLRV